MLYHFTFKKILYISLLILYGCASTGGFPERTDNVESQLDDLKSKYFHPDAAQTNGKITIYNTATDANIRKLLRNEIIYSRLLAIDLQFSIFQEAIYKEGVVSNLTLDILGVGVGAAGGVVSNLTTSQILSALSGGIAGSKTAINKNLYYERTLPALFSLMIANREKIKIEIYEGLKLDDIVYPLGRGFADLERYYIAGSIPGAIASVNEEAGKKKAEATIEFKELRNKETTDAAIQGRINNLLDSVDKLNAGKALDILQNPPVKLSNSINTVITASRGTTELKALSDIQAKSILKRVLVFVSRSEEDLKAWEAAVIAE